MPTICSQLFYPNSALWIPQTLCVTHLRSFIMCSQMFVFPEFHYHTLGAYLCFLCALLLKGPFRLRLQLWYWVDDLHSSASATHLGIRNILHSHFMKQLSFRCKNSQGTAGILQNVGCYEDFSSCNISSPQLVNGLYILSGKQYYAAGG